MHSPDSPDSPGRYDFLWCARTPLDAHGRSHSSDQNLIFGQRIVGVCTSQVWYPFHFFFLSSLENTWYQHEAKRLDPSGSIRYIRFCTAGLLEYIGMMDHLPTLPSSLPSSLRRGASTEVAPETLRNLEVAQQATHWSNKIKLSKLSHLELFGKTLGKCRDVLQTIGFYMFLCWNRSFIDHFRELEAPNTQIQHWALKGHCSRLECLQRFPLAAWHLFRPLGQ